MPLTAPEVAALDLVVAADPFTIQGQAMMARQSLAFRQSEEMLKDLKTYSDRLKRILATVKGEPTTIFIRVMHNARTDSYANSNPHLLAQIAFRVAATLDICRTESA